MLRKLRQEKAALKAQVVQMKSDAECAQEAHEGERRLWEEKSAQWIEEGAALKVCSSFSIPLNICIICGDLWHFIIFVFSYLLYTFAVAIVTRNVNDQNLLLLTRGWTSCECHE